jgi:hypothetical protein
MRCSLNDGSGPDRYRTTNPPPPSGPPPVDQAPILPYEIEEPDDDKEEGATPVVRRITDATPAARRITDGREA